MQTRQHTANNLWERVSSTQSRRIEATKALKAAAIAWAHLIVAGRVFVLLSNYAEKHNLGQVTGEADVLILTTDYYSVRTPDVGFVAKHRLPKGTQRFTPLVPDLAVKVTSAKENKKALEQKIINYMRHGTNVVWIIRPSTRTVDVYSLGIDGKITMEFLTGEDVLEGGDMLPGFSVPVSSVFPK